MDESTVLVSAAMVIASTPALWMRLLAEHVAGRDGRCRACHSQVYAAPRWPCRIAVLASTAQGVHQRSRASLN